MDKLRDEIARIIQEVLEQGQRQGYELSLPDTPNGISTDINPFIDQTLDSIEQAGYVNLSEWLNEEAEGWVIRPGWLAPNPYLKGEEFAWHMNEIHDRCQERTATRAEALANKATWVGEG